MEFDQFVSSLKPFTKIMMIGIVIEAALVTMTIIDPKHFVLLFPDQWKHVGLSGLEVRHDPVLQRQAEPRTDIRADLFVRSLATRRTTSSKTRTCRIGMATMCTWLSSCTSSIWFAN